MMLDGAEPAMEETQLGWRQQQILDALESGPRTTTELNACMDDPGPVSVKLTRGALCMLEKRGLVHRHDASHGSGRPIVWRLARN